jgi:hypothetical protein
MQILKNLFKERTPAHKLKNVLKSMKLQLGIASAMNDNRVGNSRVSLEISNIRACMERAIAELEGK